MAEDKRFILAKLALEQGDRFQARDHLSSLLKEDQENIEYWLLMSTVVDSKKEQVLCLRKVLDLDPKNKDARLGMILLGAHQPGELRAAPIKSVDWSKNLPDLRKKETPKSKTKKSKYDYKRLVPLVTGGAVILIILFFSGLLFPGVRSIFSPRLTITPITQTPSVDPGSSAYLTGTQDPILQIPIGKVLDATYTPTPVYVLTPHPGYGTYQSAIEAYQRGDFETMLTYMEQTAEQLETSDIVYLVGEALRNLGRYHEAKEKFERVIYIDPEFAPAYYSRALITPILTPGTDIKADLDQALMLDPEFGPAYIERAKYFLDRDQYQLAYQDATRAVNFTPRSHLAHYYLAKASLELGLYEDAEIAIYQSLQIDINYIPSYLVAGIINLEVGNPEEALELLNRYDPYDSNKSWQYYYSLGKAYYLVGDDLSKAEELLSQAVSMGGNSKELFFARAIVYYELGDLSKAVNEAFKARDLDRLDFTVNQYLSELLYKNGQFSLALVYLNISNILAQSDSEFATVYFWRAFTYEELGLYDQSISDWRSLMELSLENVPDEWEIIAAEKLIPTATPTPTSTFTPTYTPTITPSATLTPLVTETPAPSPTP